jgi:hypothetical protein
MGRAWLAILGVGLSLAVAELVLRLSSPIPSEALLPLSPHERRLKRLTTGEAYIQIDQELGWVTTPDVKREALGVTYRTNRAGMRADREYPAEPAPGTRRLAAFGDSYTYCHEVEIGDCWTTRLERSWSETEVLNLGVPGYGPDQAWLRYQRDGPAFRPCGVLIGYMVENINRVVNRYRPFLEPSTDLRAGKPRFVLDGDGLKLLANPVSDLGRLGDPLWVEQTLGPGDRWYFPGALVPNPLDGLQVVRLARTAAFRAHRGDPDVSGVAQAYRDQGEAFQLAARVLIAFAEQVRRDGATPVVVVLTTPSEISSLVRGGTPVHLPLLDWLRRAGIPTVDVTDALVDEARRAGVDAVVEFHYRPLGNEVVAKALADRLPTLVAGTCG